MHISNNKVTGKSHELSPVKVTFIYIYSAVSGQLVAKNGIENTKCEK